MKRPVQTTAVPLPHPLFRGERRLRIALAGLPGGGKSALFRAVASTAVSTGALAGTGRRYDECAVQIGLDQARVIDLPSVRSLRAPEPEDRATLKYLLWGDERPLVSAHEARGPPAPFAPPDVIVQVIDATALERHLELTLERVLAGERVSVFRQSTVERRVLDQPLDRVRQRGAGFRNSTGLTVAQRCRPFAGCRNTAPCSCSMTAVSAPNAAPARQPAR